MEYSRFFMPLAEEAKGYEFKGRTPAGRCIVEARGNESKLSVWVQDLKPETRYTIYLVFNQMGQHVGINMGQLAVDSKGKGEVRRDILAAQLFTFLLKDIIAVAIVDVGAGGVVSPLCGYKDERVHWRHGFKEHKVEKPAEKPAEEPRAKIVEPAPMPSPVEEVAAAEDIPVIEEAPPVPAVIPSPPLATIPEPPIEEATQNTNTLEFFESILNSSTPCQPFSDEDDDTIWVRCEKFGEISFLTNDSSVMNAPFILASWADHEHFILGIKTESSAQQFFLGVPGTYSTDGLLAARPLGFTMFRSCNRKNHGIGDEGYWLMTLSLN